MDSLVDPFEHAWTTYCILRYGYRDMKQPISTL